jgi:hypothetical protein
MRYLLSLKRTDTFSKYLRPDTVLINSFWGSSVDENVDHLLLAFENVCSAPTLPRTEKFEEYVRAGAIPIIAVSTEHSLGEPWFWKEVFRKDYGDRAVCWSWEDMFNLDQNIHAPSPQIVMRNLAAALAANEAQTRPPDAIRQFTKALEENYRRQEERFLAQQAVHITLYNMHRQSIFSGIIGAVSSANSRAENALKALGRRSGKQAGAALIETIFENLQIYAPKDLSAAQILDARTSKACRRLRVRIAEVANSAGEAEEKRRIILSDLRRELERVNRVVERWGRVETIVLSGAMSGVGALIGGLPGAVVGGAGGVALAEPTKDAIREFVGRRSWAYMFHRMSGG